MATQQMMQGDWTCPNCQDHQFARNSTCRRCNTPKPTDAPNGAAAQGAYGGGSAYGNAALAGAGASAISPGGAGGADVRPGDWHCPACFDLQFARNSVCRRCNTPRPPSGPPAMGGAPLGALGGMSQMSGAGGGHDQMRPGDWTCPNCNDLVFARNDTCRRCSTPRPPSPGASGMTNGYSGGGAAGWSAGGMGGAGDAAPALGSFDNSQMSRPGDWNCPSCGDLQFARNTTCRRCGQPAPTSGGGVSQAHGQFGGGYGGVGGYSGGGGSMVPAAGGSMVQTNPNARPGDWNCASCGDFQFARNTTCRRCGQPNPSSGGGASQAPGGGYGGAFGGVGGCSGGGGGGMMQSDTRPGDWTCPNCGDNVFARNDACRRCATPRPADTGSYSQGGGGRAAFSLSGPAGGSPAGMSMNMKPGDWVCPSCKDLQFARNTTCRLCNTPRPDEAGTSRSRSRSPRGAL